MMTILYYWDLNWQTTGRPMGEDRIPYMNPNVSGNEHTLKETSLKS
jgi:hypothetical protein